MLLAPLPDACGACSLRGLSAPVPSSNRARSEPPLLVAFGVVGKRAPLVPLDSCAGCRKGNAQTEELNPSNAPTRIFTPLDSRVVLTHEVCVQGLHHGQIGTIEMTEAMEAALFVLREHRK